MFEHFVAGQYIRALILDKASQSSQTHRQLREAFVKAFASDIRGTLLNDLWASHSEDEHSPPKSGTQHLLLDDMYQLLQTRLSTSNLPHTVLRQPVFMRPNFTRKGVKFSTYVDSPGNSNIVFGGYPHANWSAGRITAIFLWEVVKSDGHTYIPCCIVEPLHHLTEADARIDPYRAFPSRVAGKLFYSMYESPIVLLPDDIICHFAGVCLRPQGSNISLTHALPLDRVGQYLIERNAELTSEYTGLILYTRGDIVGEAFVVIVTYSWSNSRIIVLRTCELT